MKQLAKFALTVLAGTASVGAFAAGPFEEWEMVTTVSGGNFPQAAGGAGGQTMIVCQKKMDGTKAPTMPADQNCTYSTMKQSGDKGVFTMECKGTPPDIPPSTIKGEGTATADTMEGKMNIVAGGHEVTINYSGKRVGSCDKEGSRMAGGSMLPGMDMGSMMDPRNRPQRVDAASRSRAGSDDPGAQHQEEPQRDSAPKGSDQDGKKDEAKDVAGKAVDAAKKAIGSFLPF